MQLNQGTDYAFRVVLHLSMLPEGSIVSGQQLAEKQKIPARFLQKIMRQLTAAGLTRSFRGIEGGFSLQRKAAEISLLDVITALEGPLLIQRCLQDQSECSRSCSKQCEVHRVLNEAQRKLTAELEAARFDQLAQAEKKRLEEGENE